MESIDPSDERSLKVATVQLSGEYDLARRVELIEVLCTPADPIVVADFTDVWFIDSPGISALVVAHRVITEDGRTLVLTELSDAMRELLRITGLDQVFGLDT